jgi:hypothetical protein
MLVKQTATLEAKKARRRIPKDGPGLFLLDDLPKFETRHTRKALAPDVTQGIAFGERIFRIEDVLREAGNPRRPT